MSAQNVTLDRGAAALGSTLASVGTTGRVLTVAAHPDDEDTPIIAWLAKGRHVETAYLSLTRGDGGQNLIGNELGEALGAIRTQELLSARRIDGGRQYFTRAYDFGFSKNAEETYTHWPKDSILGDVVRVVHEQASYALFRRDGHFAELVTGELAGRFEAPIYGMFAVEDAIAAQGADDIAFSYAGQPKNETGVTVLWDGEWEVTSVTFRDMGAAYAVGLVLIYLLVVAQFGSYFVPLIIMAPIPLTIIGVMPGHALLGAQFTATSMIGMIALAGIIVRNSILLVDFINTERAAGRDLADAVVAAATVRAKPIALTALAAMTGAFFILDDPIFNGLAISLIFGIFVSTVLTLVVIPVGYFAYLSRRN